MFPEFFYELQILLSRSRKHNITHTLHVSQHIFIHTLHVSQYIFIHSLQVSQHIFIHSLQVSQHIFTHTGFTSNGKHILFQYEGFSRAEVGYLEDHVEELLPHKPYALVAAARQA